MFLSFTSKVLEDFDKKDHVNVVVWEAQIGSAGAQGGHLLQLPAKADSIPGLSSDVGQIHTAALRVTSCVG